MKTRTSVKAVRNWLRAKRELAISLNVDIADLPLPSLLNKRECERQQGIINQRMEQAGFDYTGQPLQTN